MDVHWNRVAIGEAAMPFKRKHGVGASPKGQRRTLRPYDSWKAPDDISDQEASESNKRGPQESARCSESFLEALEARWSLNLFTETTRHRKAPDVILDQEASENVKGGLQESTRRSESVLALQEARWSLSLFTGSLSHMATTRQREGAGRRS